MANTRSVVQDPVGSLRFSRTHIIAFVILCLTLTSTIYADQFMPIYCGKKVNISGMPSNKFEKSSSIPPLTGSTYQLEQVTTIIRHGDRVIASSGVCWLNDTAVWNCSLNTWASIPNHNSLQTDPVGRLYRTEWMDGRNYYPGNCAMGTLTQLGAEQELLNGHMFRQAYVHNVSLLSPNYTASEIWIRADNYYRTFQSAQECILGLYPNVADSTESVMLNIYSMDLSLDDLLPNPTLCPILGQWYDESETTPEYDNFENNLLNPLIAKLEQYTKAPINDMYFFRDCLTAHLCHDFPIPEGITEDLYYQVVNATVSIWNFSNTFPTREMSSQLGIGFLLGEFYDAWQQFMTLPNQPKFRLYSSHDTGLMPILNAFQVWDYLWVPYASFIIFELYRDTVNTSSWGIRMIYNGEVMQIPQCAAYGDGVCPWAVFNQVILPLIPTNPKVQCQKTSTSSSYDSPLPYHIRSKLHRLSYASRFNR